MEISAVKYTAGITGNNINVKVTTTDNKEFWVPIEPANADYQEVLDWVESGNTIDEA